LIQVRDATDYLHSVVIPKFAHKLTARVAHEWRAFCQRSYYHRPFPRSCACSTLKTLNAALAYIGRTQEKEKPSRMVFLATFPLKQLLHAKVRRVFVLAIALADCED
jgi:hypothetical protein